jgi:hypothetical protein
MWTLPKFRAHDRVVVRSKEQILATLDADGTLDGMPFMPEMLEHCGKEFTVSAVAHKTCDTANRTGGRKLDRTVHLTGSRCDGRAHGGCDADCLIFWKEAWLERPAEGAAPPRGVGAMETRRRTGCTEAQLEQSTQEQGPPNAPPRYRCQATLLFAASRPLAWWNVRQFALDIATGNAKPGEVLRVLGLNAVSQLRELPVGYRIWSACYEWMHRKITGRAGPFVVGKIGLGDPTPAKSSDLQPGETVRIKDANEIGSTLNQNNRNRGMWFGPDQAPYCGGTYRVRKRVSRIIDERTGEMVEMKTPCITLDDVTCRSHYSAGRFFCPRRVMPYWREIWLDRVDAAPKQR